MAGTIIINVVPIIIKPSAIEKSTLKQSKIRFPTCTPTIFANQFQPNPNPSIFCQWKLTLLPTKNATTTMVPMASMIWCINFVVLKDPTFGWMDRNIPTMYATKKSDAQTRQKIHWEIECKIKMTGECINLILVPPKNLPINTPIQTAVDPCKVFLYPGYMPGVKKI